MLENTHIVPEFFSRYGVAKRLEKGSLLLAVNLVAGLSIFFFGYDQGTLPSREKFRLHFIYIYFTPLFPRDEGGVRIKRWIPKKREC